jgi:hypothetical protein
VAGKFYRLVESAKLRRITFYHARRSALSYLLNSGQVPIAVVAAWPGHADGAFCFGAGDGNRTRTISLGTKLGRPLSAAPCYSCMSDPRVCPMWAAESSPVRQVCETNVRENGRAVPADAGQGLWLARLTSTTM